MREYFYRRVIPRDLFNEADLLKCLGRLVILLDETRGHVAEVRTVGGETRDSLTQNFDITQDESDGAIRCENVVLCLRGVPRLVYRPLNSREPWPLWLRCPDYDDILIFTEDGRFTPDFLTYIGL